jgi:hypothetical protein
MVWADKCSTSASAILSLTSFPLLDPFEEQLNLPTAFVDVGDGLGRQVLNVGERDIVSDPFFAVDISERLHSEGSWNDGR